MSTASIFLAGIAGILVMLSLFNWWLVHDHHPSGEQRRHMRFALVTALIACLMLAIGWAAS